MVDEIDGLKKNATRIFVLFLVLNVLAIAVAFTGSTRTLYYFIAIGGLAAFVSAFSFFRVKVATNAKSLGRAAMQGLWINCSMAIGYFLAAPAPYFSSSPAVWGVGITVGAVAVIVSVLMLFRVRKITGVPLSI
jgi:hypothetical protein